MADGLQGRWGAEIRRRRQAAGLSIARLSRMTEIDQGHLSRIERGEIGTSDDSRMKLAKALGVRVEELFAYPDTTTTATTESPAVSA